MLWQILTVAGVVLGLIPLLFIRPRLRVSIVTSTIATIPDGPEADGLRLIYQGHEIPRLSRSELYVWNSGIQSVSLSRPLMVGFGDGATILRARKLRSTKGADVRLMRVGDDAVELAFDYLNHRDGVRIEIVHTAGAARPVELDAAGPNVRVGRFHPPPESPFFSVFQLCLAMAMAFGTALGILHYVSVSELPVANRVVLTVMLGLLFPVGVLGTYISIDGLQGTPRGLR